MGSDMGEADPVTVRPVVCLKTPLDRRTASHWCMTAPEGVTVEFRPAKRTDAQSRRMWAMLGDISKQARHHGMKLSPEDWKILALDALHHEMRAVPNIDGDGLVMLGRSSSALSVAEMSDLIELLYMLGTQREVRWSDPSAIRENPREAA